MGHPRKRQPPLSNSFRIRRRIGGREGGEALEKESLGEIAKMADKTITYLEAQLPFSLKIRYDEWKQNKKEAFDPSLVDEFGWETSSNKYDDLAWALVYAHCDEIQLIRLRQKLRELKAQQV